MTFRRGALLALVIVFIFAAQALADWVSEGPFGGHVYALDVVTSNTTFAGCQMEVFKTTNNCGEWSFVSDSITAKNVWYCKISALSVYHNDTDYMFAAYLYLPYDYTTNQLFKAYYSTDGGDDWTEMTYFTSNTAGVYDIEVDQTDSSIVYAVARYKSLPNDSGGVFKSTNGGSSWSNVYGARAGTAIEIDPTDSTILYAGVLNGNGASNWTGMIRSTNSGSSWSAYGLGSKTINDILICPDGDLYAACNDGLYKLTMLGWALKFGDKTLRVFCDDTTGGYKAIYAVAGNGDSLVKSTDEGDEWSTVFKESDEKVYCGEDRTSSSEDYIYIGTSPRGVYLSRNGGSSWNEESEEMTDIKVNGFDVVVATSPYWSNDTFYVATGHGVWRSYNSGGRWTLKNSSLSDTSVLCIRVDPDDHDVVYCGTTAGYVYKSTNNGDTWTQKLYKSAFKIGDIEVKDTIVYVLAQEKTCMRDTVFFSSDGGTNWTARGFPVDISTNDLEFMPSNPETIFAIGSCFTCRNVGTVYRSTDYGANWTLVLGPIEEDTCEAAILYRGEVSRDSSYVVFVAGVGDVGATESVYRSASSGDAGSWSAISTGLTTSYAIHGITMPQNPDGNLSVHLVEDVEGHFWMSDYSNSSWSGGPNAGLHARYYTDLLSYGTGTVRQLYAGTMGMGLFRTQLLIPKGFPIKDAEKSAFETSNEQIAKEEVHPSISCTKNRVTFAFAIKLSDAANLRIYDVSGRMVKQLDLREGTGKVVWNCGNDNIATGIFFYALSSNGKTSRGKFILLR